VQQLDLFPASAFCERWTDRRHSWRHVSEGGFDRSRYEVAAIDELVARAYVERHHYSGSYPASSQRYGIFERGELAGVAVLSVPVRAEVLTGVFPDLVPYAESLELGRLVLADRVPANAESWMLARVWELAVAEGIRGIVSFSDPMPRAAGDRLIMPGHVGIIYQSSNALYLGRGRARWLHLLPDATTLNDRAIAKVKSQDRGHEYVERRLVAFGARMIEWGENPSDWLAEALETIGVRRIKHRGNHRYAFALGTPAERRSVFRMIPIERRAYPKTVDKAA
jgi:hypothetical protein